MPTKVSTSRQADAAASACSARGAVEERMRGARVGHEPMCDPGRGRAPRRRLRRSRGEFPHRRRRTGRAPGRCSSAAWATGSGRSARARAGRRSVEADDPVQLVILEAAWANAGAAAEAEAHHVHPLGGTAGGVPESGDARRHVGADRCALGGVHVRHVLEVRSPEARARGPRVEVEGDGVDPGLGQATGQLQVERVQAADVGDDHDAGPAGRLGPGQVAGERRSRRPRSATPRGRPPRRPGSGGSGGSERQSRGTSDQATRGQATDQDCDPRANTQQGGHAQVDDGPQVHGEVPSMIAAAGRLPLAGQGERRRRAAGSSRGPAPPPGRRGGR